MVRGIGVLHVDDEPSFSDLTAELLERENDQLTVETATSADEGLQRVTDRPPDCVVSDYNMPGMNGLEFLRAVRKEHLDLPFILYTGKGSEEVASEALRAGATDYIQKQSGSEQYELLANRIENAVTQHWSEQRLHETQKEYTTVFKNAQNALIIVHVEDDGFRYQQCNPRAIELIGRDKAEIVGNTPHEALGVENGTKVVGAYRTCIERREPVMYTLTLDLPMGEVIRECEVTPVSSDGEIEQLVVEFRDITDRKSRKRKLETLNSQYQTLVENFPDGAVYLIDTDFECIRAGGKELSKVGLSPDNIEGKKPHALFPEEIANELCHYYQEALNGNANTFEQEYRSERYRIQTAPVRTDDETIQCVMAVSQNITEYVEDKQKLKRQNQRLDEFTSIVSHDLRNPLRVVHGRLELIRQESESDHIDDAAQALDRMDTLIEDLLTLAQEGWQVDEAEPVGLADVAKNSWQTADTGRAALEIDTSGVINSDQSRLQQLFENLYNNAFKHNEETVTVSVGTIEGGFYVADTGSGIPESSPEKIFEEGYSTSEDGSGLGLRIVEQIVEAHGWDITVTEGEYSGARFEITAVDFVDS